MHEDGLIYHLSLIVILCSLIGVVAIGFSLGKQTQNQILHSQNKVNELVTNSKENTESILIQSNEQAIDSNKQILNDTITEPKKENVAPVYEKYSDNLNNEKHQAEIQENSWGFEDWIGLSVFVFGCIALSKQFIMSILDSYLVKKATDAEFGNK